VILGFARLAGNARDAAHVNTRPSRLHVERMALGDMGFQGFEALLAWVMNKAVVNHEGNPFLQVTFLNLFLSNIFRRHHMKGFNLRK